MSDFDRDTLDRLVELGNIEMSYEFGVWHGAGKVGQIPHALPRQTANPVALGTLSGLARFIARNVDRVNLADHLVVVQRPDRVEFVSAADPGDRTREVLAVAAYDVGPYAEAIGRERHVHQMAEVLACHFAASEARDELVSLLYNVRISEAKIQTSKGLGWKASAEVDVDGDGWERVEGVVPRWDLTPYRMFPESALVSSPFTIPKPRLTDEGVFVRLLPLDGGAWVPAGTAAVGAAMERELGAAAKAAGVDEAPFVIW